ncbi:hypothetical protein [Jatrophihabitans sp.]|uniref:hypothetical protein n=1 Tax=Jatrophihabitans sp. TaxID=1932789 RepID=UPI0038CD8790
MVAIGSDARARRLTAAVHNNAAWCDAVCRAHGVPTSWQSDWWAARQRSPRFYPDAITLRPGAAFAAVAGSVEAGRGSSVKDSWADLDLEPYGFTPLFDAHWITLNPPARGETVAAADRFRWTVVGSAHELLDWTAAHGADGTFPPSLLADPAIRFLAVRSAGRTVAGAIANLSGPVVGVSNVFGEDPWQGLVHAVGNCFPQRPLVGYEQAAELDRPLSLGFHTIGQLRVWHQPEADG